jgi:hypothetical protein
MFLTRRKIAKLITIELQKKCDSITDRFGQNEEKSMYDSMKKTISSLTEIGMGLLALAIVASLLVGPGNMSFLGDVVGNITALVRELGSAGLAGLISLGVVLWLFQR